MAIVTETYGKYIDGKSDLILTKSDEGKYIISDETGAEYEQAIDPDFEHRTYTESDKYIPVEPEVEEAVEEE